MKLNKVKQTKTFVETIELTPEELLKNVHVLEILLRIPGSVSPDNEDGTENWYAGDGDISWNPDIGRYVVVMADDLEDCPEVSK